MHSQKSTLDSTECELTQSIARSLHVAFFQLLADQSRRIMVDQKTSTARGFPTGRFTFSRQACTERLRVTLHLFGTFRYERGRSPEQTTLCLAPSLACQGQGAPTIPSPSLGY